MLWRSLLISVLAFLLVGHGDAQVFADHNLPRVMPTGENVEAEFIIYKPETREFVQYELYFQTGLAVHEVNSAGGTFKSDNNRIKIMWSIAPQSPEIRIRLAFVAGSAGTFTIGHRLEYVTDGEKRVALFEDLALMAQPGAAVPSPGAFTRIQQVIPKKLPSTRIDSMENSLRDPAKAAVHIAQLRRDAHEARKVGESELKKADLELADAKKQLEKSRRIGGEAERSKAVKQAEAEVQKAETNRQIAQKILVLAKTLEENADQIARARRSDSAAAVSDPAGAAMVSSTKIDDRSPAASDTLYCIQVGAFSQHPGKSPYAALGTVKIVNEGGLYKVLLGKYPTRSQAVDLQLRLASEGLEGFVVKYSGDRRIK